VKRPDVFCQAMQLRGARIGTIHDFLLGAGGKPTLTHGFAEVPGWVARLLSGGFCYLCRGKIMRALILAFYAPPSRQSDHPV